MSSIATLNGVQYIVPAYNDTGWAQGAGNLSLYLAAIAANTLQPTGGSFTLTADVDFGANFGIKALYLKSETANISTSGVIRLASADTIGWRNNANGANIALGKDSSDNLQWNATKILLSGAVVNADINASAAIAYSKLALTGAILNADLAGSIAYSKLSLTGSIVNGDLTAGTILNSAINASAAIALTKLAVQTVSRTAVFDSGGFLSPSNVTTTELSYVSGVTSAIQTQLNATVANPLVSNLAAGSHKITGLTDATAAQDVPSYKQVKILQVLSSTSSTETSSTSATYADATGVTITITPTTSSSKIFIVCSVSNRLRLSAQVDINGALRLVGTTNGILISRIDVAYNSGSSVTQSILLSNSVSYLDSPGTTAAQTYKIQLARLSGAGTFYVNDGGSSVSTITVFEVNGL